MSCVFRCATCPSPIHRPEGVILYGLLCVRHGHQPDWPFPQHHRHARPLQRVRRHVQHALHHPVQPDSGVSAWRRGTGLSVETFCSMLCSINKIQKKRERGAQTKIDTRKVQKGFIHANQLGTKKIPRVLRPATLKTSEGPFPTLKLIYQAKRKLNYTQMIQSNMYEHILMWAMWAHWCSLTLNTEWREYPHVI